MSEWRQRAAGAVEAEFEHARQGGEWSMLGPLRRTVDGEHLVDLRGRRVRPLLDVRCSGPDGPRQSAAVPVSAEYHHGLLWLDDVGPVPSGCDHVWARESTHADLLARLARGLRDLGAAPLADRLAHGMLDPAGQDAYATCFVPGVHLVWGPPGSGKSHVAAEAAAELARRGSRVLLVTSEAAATRASLTAVSDPERFALQTDLAELSEVERHLRDMDDELRDYDHEAFLAAGRRIENAQRAAALETDFARLRERHWQRARELSEAREALGLATRTHDRVAGEHARRAEGKVLTQQLTAVEENLAGIRERSRHRGLLSRGRRADREELRAAEEQRRALVARIEDCRRRVTTVSDDVKALRAAVDEAGTRADEAERAESEVRAQLDLVRGELGRLRASGIGDDADHRYYADCLHRNLPNLHADREAVRERGRHRAALRGRFEERLWWIGERGHELRCGDESWWWRSEAVVVTTMDGLAAAEGDFDVVLVDDAGSARLCDVLFAVGRARETAVVFGDLAQPWPQVVPEWLEQRADVRQWILSTPFSHCGILTPSDAHAHPGCAVLTGQYRVGPAIQAIASDIGYTALLAAEGRHTDVVLLDTAGEPVERAALVGLIAEDGGAVLVPSEEQIAGWRDVLRDTLGVDVGTVGTVTGHEFPTVVLDLTGDGWYDRVRSFISGIARARDRLYLLADLGAVRSAPTGTPLGAVRALELQGGLQVRRLGEVLIPRQRQQSATDWTVTVINREPADGTIPG
ncbi:hypothetical protein [Saccharomonospora piscinae]|uniref:hypothetical protein n=1 Tax=Saccharomonospora piscinae TaxID=687388 RepID=UPI0004656AFA|nr:hypothetical protein [Saccharomonospora piscinae]